MPGYEILGLVRTGYASLGQFRPGEYRLVQVTS
jgi:hypothetical protein